MIASVNVGFGGGGGLLAPPPEQPGPGTTANQQGRGGEQGMQVRLGVGTIAGEQ